MAIIINPKFIVTGNIDTYEVEIRVWEETIDILLINPDYRGHKISKKIPSIPELTEQNCLQKISQLEGIVDYFIQAKSLFKVQN